MALTASSFFPSITIHIRLFPRQSALRQISPARDVYSAPPKSRMHKEDKLTEVLFRRVYNGGVAHYAPSGKSYYVQPRVFEVFYPSAARYAPAWRDAEGGVFGAEIRIHAKQIFVVSRTEFPKFNFFHARLQLAPGNKLTGPLGLHEYTSMELSYEESIRLTNRFPSI